MTIRTLLVDDEKLATQGLQLRLDKFDDIEVIGTCANGREAIRAIKTEKPDLVFLDIQMPGFDGFSVIQGLMEVEPPLVVFVTAYSDHAIRAFEAQAVDYLLKPVSPDRLARALSRVREWRATERAPAQKSKWINEFWVQNRGEMLRIDAAQVDLIEAERDYMRLHLGARSWLIHQTIKSLEARMNPDQFMRIHRSKMIRREGIVGLKHHGDGAWSVDLGEGGVHRIGRTYLHDVKAIMHQA